MSVFSKKSSPSKPSAFNVRKGEDFFGVQAKLSIGKSNDKYEVEADNVADKIVSQKQNKNSSESFFNPPPVVQKKANEMQKQSKTENVLQEKSIAESITPVVQLKLEKESVQNKIESLKPKEKKGISKSLVQSKKEEDIQKNDTAEKVDSPSVKTESATTENLKNKEKSFAPKPLQNKKEENIQAKEEEETNTKDDEKELQMSASADANPSDTSNLESTLNSSKDGGSSMSGKVRTEMESGFGTDFSAIKIHNDSRAVQMNRQLGSQAFATGNNIYFNEGKYNPESQSGKHLLAHELTHTVQQGASIQKKDTPQIQKDDTESSSVQESIDAVYNALDGWTDSDDSAIIWNNFRNTDKTACDALVNGVAISGNNSVDATLNWLYDDMVTSDWNNLFSHLVSVNAYRTDYLIANQVYSFLSGYTSKSNSNSILQIYRTGSGIRGDLLGSSLSQLETIVGYDRNETVAYLFGDSTSSDAHHLSLHFFASENLKAAGYAAYWIASKVFNLISGYTSSSDSTDIVNNFLRVPEELCSNVLYELNTLCLAEWGDTAENCLMEDMWQSDYEQLRTLMPLAAYNPNMNWLEWTWDKITVGFDFLAAFVEYVVCGIVGIIWGIVTVVIDIISAVIDIAIAIKDLIGLVIYFVTGGALCRENKERVWNFFSSIGLMFDAPGQSISTMLDELTLEGSLIEGPFKQCQQAIFWVSRIINFVVNIILIIAWGYGAIKLLFKGIETIIGLARAGELVTALRLLPSRIWTKIANMPSSVSRSFVLAASRVINLFKNPLTIIQATRSTITLIRMVAADENFYIFLRRQAGNYVEGEVEFWRNRREFWRQGTIDAEIGLNTAEGKLTAAVEATSDDVAKAEQLISEAETEANLRRNQCNELKNEINNGREGGARPIPGSPEAERLAAAWEATLNDQTRTLLNADPELRRFWHEMDPDIRRLLTYCNSPCIPIGVSPENITLIGQLKQRLGITSDHLGLREYLHMSFENNATLRDAIRALDQIATVRELELFFDNELIKFIFREHGVTIRRAANGLWEYPKDGGYVIEFELNTHRNLTNDRGTRSFFQSHHGIQDKWAIRRFQGLNVYNSRDARAILLRTRNMSGGSSGTPHGLINQSQINRSATILERTFLQERTAMLADLSDIRVPDAIRNQYLSEINNYFRGIFDQLQLTKTPEELETIFGFRTWQN